MVLYIDTTDFNKVIFAVSDGKKVTRKVYRVDPRESHETLGKLKQLFKFAKVKPETLTKIIVNKGPGSYTGVRIGVVMAQAFGFAWRIPIQAVAKGKFKLV